MEGIREKLREVLFRYKGEKGNLIPILQEVQDRFGYLPREAMEEIAKFLRMPASNVYGVATFYSQFRLTPGGKRTIKVCVGSGCHVCGGGQIRREVEKWLGIKPGETADDSEYSLEIVSCAGACSVAPVVVVDGNVYGRMTIARVREILKGTKAG